MNNIITGFMEDSWNVKGWIRIQGSRLNAMGSYQCMLLFKIVYIQLT